MITLEDVFAEELPAMMSGFVERPLQVALARSIQDVMSGGGSGVFEAGTGAGKTLAYLVPAMLSDEPVIVSTGTRNLQDQLMRKDLPVLSRLFPQKKVRLLKGRGNYLCPYRLKRSLEAGKDILGPELQAVKTWAATSSSGDLSEFIDTESNRQLLGMVTSTRDNCLGSRCPEFVNCPVYRARQQAAEADVVVVNHHLLFADLGRKDDNVPALLPRVGSLIIDEAHQLPDVATRYFGTQLSSGQLTGFARDIRTELKLLGNDDPLTAASTTTFEDRCQRLRQLIHASDARSFATWQDDTSRQAVIDTDHALEALCRQLEQVADRSRGLQHLATRAVRMMDDFVLLTESIEAGEDFVHWIDRSGEEYTLHLSPLSVADDIRAVMDDSKAAWVFTSATLSVDGSFEHFSDQMGLCDVNNQIYASPFDYETSLRGYVPPGLPEPGDDAHTSALLEHCLPLLNTNPGRTLFLFTSHRALRHAEQSLRGFSRPVFSQGQLSRTELVERFRESEGSVLLATQSFWEGVDLRGSSLHLLIIDKLPFPNPSDPLASARADHLAGNGFAGYALPRATLSLRQGFGRLIREDGDRGLFVLGDPRVITRQYGSSVLGNLPDFPWISGRDDAEAWLHSL